MWDLPVDLEESSNKDTPEAEALLDAMHAHSEEWCAGWLTDQEYYLWSVVIDDQQWDRIGPDAYARRDLLRTLSDLAGGWWIWGGPEGRTFLPLNVWQRRYAAREPNSSEP